MAFGKVLVMPQGKMPKKEKTPPKSAVPEKKVEIRPRTLEKGAVHLNALVIAETGVEAADCLCSVYFSMSHRLAGSEVAVYTSEFATISRLTEVKQNLEDAILKPVGREIPRLSPEEGEPLLHCTLTFGQSGNQALAADLECQWTAPGEAAGKSADLVIALLNWAEGPEAAARIIHAAQSFSCPVVWMICGFESKVFFWGTEDDQILRNTVRDALKQDLAIEGKSGDVVAYAQIYGGLEFVRREADGSAVYRTYRQCREYVPVGSYAGVLAAVTEVLRNRDTDSASQTLRQMLQARLKECASWYTVCTAEGGEG